MYKILYYGMFNFIARHGFYCNILPFSGISTEKLLMDKITRQNCRNLKIQHGYTAADSSPQWPRNVKGLTFTLLMVDKFILSTVQLLIPLMLCYLNILEFFSVLPRVGWEHCVFTEETLKDMF